MKHPDRYFAVVPDSSRISTTCHRNGGSPHARLLRKELKSSISPHRITSQIDPVRINRELFQKFLYDFHHSIGLGPYPPLLVRILWGNDEAGPAPVVIIPGEGSGSPRLFRSHYITTPAVQIDYQGIAGTLAFPQFSCPEDSIFQPVTLSTLPVPRKKLGEFAIRISCFPRVISGRTVLALSDIILVFFRKSSEVEGECPAVSLPSDRYLTISRADVFRYKRFRFIRRLPFPHLRLGEGTNKNEQNNGKETFHGRTKGGHIPILMQRNCRSMDERRVESTSRSQGDFLVSDYNRRPDATLPPTSVRRKSRPA